jgi:hypothetical protein
VEERNAHCENRDSVHHLVGRLSGLYVVMYGSAEYAKTEKKACTVCHAKVAGAKAEMAKNLNSTGTCYKDNDHSLAKCEAAKK